MKLLVIVSDRTVIDKKYLFDLIADHSALGKKLDLPKNVLVHLFVK